MKFYFCMVIRVYCLETSCELRYSQVKFHLDATYLPAVTNFGRSRHFPNWRLQRNNIHLCRDKILHSCPRWYRFILWHPYRIHRHENFNPFTTLRWHNRQNYTTTSLSTETLFSVLLTKRQIQTNAMKTYMWTSSRLGHKKSGKDHGRRQEMAGRQDSPT